MSRCLLEKKRRDTWLTADRSRKLLVRQPDRFYLQFVYQVLYNHLYHMDTDSILVDMQTLEPVAVMEWIKGLDNQITDFKLKVYCKIAKRLNIPFFIINWDATKGVKVTDVFQGVTVFQTWSLHTQWLRNLKYRTGTHSECCDCYQCIPDYKGKGKGIRGM
jgi:hypothetical protein